MNEERFGDNGAPERKQVPANLGDGKWPGVFLEGIKLVTHKNREI